MAAKTAGRSRNSSRRKAKSPWVIRVKVALWVLGMLFIIPTCVFLVLFMQEKNNAMADIDKIRDLRNELQVKPSEIVASDGTLLYQVSGELREYAPLSEIPVRVQNAMIAAEDRRFRTRDQGVDWIALLRTLKADTEQRRLAQGASTLQMQLAKLVSSNGEKTFARKFHDMALAEDIQSEMDKNQVLELYLNKVYFGNHAYGIKAAADVYFGKPLDKLTLGEAAFLVRLVRRPSSWNNLLEKENLDKAIQNRNSVLGVMLEEGMISHEEYDNAIAEKPKFNRKPPTSSARILRAPYFVNHVIDQFHRQFPDMKLSDGGIRIETTLDPQMQELAEREVSRVVAAHRRDLVTTAAFVLMNTDGQILAEVGGADFDKNQYNMIYQGKRQPGSSFKPFVYATALNAGAIKMDDMLPNTPVTFPAPPGGAPWTPHNSSKNENQPSVSVPTAFALSMNIPAAHVIDKVTPQEVVRTAHDVFGFVSELQPVLPLCLGSDAVNPLEVAQALSVFALRGDRATPYVLKRVIGPTGEVLKEFSPRIVRDVFSPDTCAQVDELMQDVVKFGTGYKARIVPDARGKTGTTDDNRDAWFIGYTDGLIGVGWIANEHRSKSGRPIYDPMARSVFGGTVTVDFWASVMKAAHEKYGERFALPSRVEDKPGKAEAPPLDKDTDKPAPTTDDVPKMGPQGDGDSGTASDGTQPDTPAAPPDDGTPKADSTPTASPATTPSRSGAPKTQETSDSDQYVEVEICTDSGMKASIYCPETVIRRFKKGTEPKKVCTLHTG